MKKHLCILAALFCAACSSVTTTTGEPESQTASTVTPAKQETLPRMIFLNDKLYVDTGRLAYPTCGTLDFWITEGPENTVPDEDGETNYSLAGQPEDYRGGQGGFWNNEIWATCPEGFCIFAYNETDLPIEAESSWTDPNTLAITLKNTTEHAYSYYFNSFEDSVMLMTTKEEPNNLRYDLIELKGDQKEGTLPAGKEETLTFTVSNNSNDNHSTSFETQIKLTDEQGNETYSFIPVSVE